MTGTVCSVANCRSNRAKAKKAGEMLRFFTFPRSEEIRKQWVRLCHRKDFDPKQKRICSKHFELDQYEDRIEAKLTNRLPKRLKETAIPTLFLSEFLSIKAQKGSTARTKRLKTRLKIKKPKETVAKLLPPNNEPNRGLPPVPDNPDIKNNIATNIDDLPSTSKQSPYEILLEKYRALQKENEILKFQLLIKENNFKDVLEKNKILQDIVDEWERSSQVKVKELLADFLTHDQLEFVLKKET